MKKLGTLACLLTVFVCWNANAANKQQDTSTHFKISAENLTCLKLSERHDDELYFMLTIIDKNGNYSFKRVPEFPEIFLFKKGDKKPDILLLDSTIKESNPQEVIITLVEHDAARMNPDDVLGAAKVTLKVDHGRLTTKWSSPSSKYAPTSTITTHNNQPEYDMTGDDGHYKVSFHVKS